jgi:uncharacterized metal-binding protein YceD (DUF177 family)
MPPKIYKKLILLYSLARKMKGKNFEIKIADLLNHVGTDTLAFEQKKTAFLPNLTDEGIKGTFLFHSVDGDSVFVKLVDVACGLHERCENCGKEFIRPLYVDQYSAKFTRNPQELEESEEEVLFLIDRKNATIDVEEMLSQAVQLEAPFVIKCEECLLQ